MPITRYICTQSNFQTFSDSSLCNVSSELWTCETEGGARPNLLDSDTRGDGGTYRLIILTPLWCWTFPKDGVFRVVYWHSNVTLIYIPAPGLSVHSSEHLSSNTDRTVIPILSGESIHNDAHLVVMNFTARACGRYLRINITSVFFTPERD